MADCKHPDSHPVTGQKAPFPSLTARGLNCLSLRPCIPASKGGIFLFFLFISPFFFFFEKEPVMQVFIGSLFLFGLLFGID